MSTFRNPVGPQPSSVYWRRRLVVGLGLLAVVIIIVLIVVAPRGDNATPEPSGTPSNPASSEGPSTPAEPLECADGVVTVTAVADKSSYQAGELPKISFTITNTGAVACTFNAGSDVQEYLITSGTDGIWNSTHCQVDPVAAVVELDPSATMSSTPISWDRTRSTTTTCDADRAQVTAKGATYKLQVIVDGVESPVVAFLLY